MHLGLSRNLSATYLCGEINLRKVSDTNLQTESTHLVHIRDEAAFEEMFRGYHQQLCRYAFTIVKDADQAQEMVQDVFLRIWERRGTIEITTSVKAYLYRSVHNACLNLNQQKKKEVRMDEVSLKVIHPSANAEERVQDGELNRAIASGLDKLPAECRKVFEMSRFGEMKYREIADALGISVKTVENQMGKALRIMREQLSDYLPVLFPVFLYQLFQLIPVL